jgi:hypothetical protein
VLERCERPFDPRRQHRVVVLDVPSAEVEHAVGVRGDEVLDEGRLERLAVPYHRAEVPLDHAPHVLGVVAESGVERTAQRVGLDAGDL